MSFKNFLPQRRLNNSGTTRAEHWLPCWLWYFLADISCSSDETVIESYTNPHCPVHCRRALIQREWGQKQISARKSTLLAVETISSFACSNVRISKAQGKAVLLLIEESLSKYKDVWLVWSSLSDEYELATIHPAGCRQQGYIIYLACNLFDLVDSDGGANDKHSFYIAFRDF